MAGSEAVFPDLQERDDYSRGAEGRRLKAAFVAVGIWFMVVALYIAPGGYRAVLTLVSLLLLQAFRMVLATPEAAPAALAGDSMGWPTVTLVAAAKDEEEVIERLVQNLCDLDYPRDRCEVWIVDDHSQDATPEILRRLQSQYSQLRVLRRSAGATGGKSGALNQVLMRSQGEFLAVFDADAQVPRDLLRRSLPYFEDEAVGAVQVRKIIANAEQNFWTQGQSAEMMLDACFQQQRTAIGGLGELRGNGQFLRRSALEQCGGFNEETITDDLDLTLRLNLDQWDIKFSIYPGVLEEAVTSPRALWHQRNRWAEGGYQRYLDYWRLIADNRMGTNRTVDLLGFLLIQYLLPIAMVPDFLLALMTRRLPLLGPLGMLLFGLLLWAQGSGLRRSYQAERGQPMPLSQVLRRMVRGLLYMMHWSVVMPWVTARMAVAPKRLKWVKTTHHGA